MEIRLAQDQDFEDIFEIWLSGIGSSFNVSSINIEFVKEKFKLNFLKRKDIFNYWVAVDTAQKILGWQSLNKMTVNPLKEDLFAESSTYIHKDARKMGIGELLVAHAMKEAEKSNLQFVTALINDTNEAVRKIATDTGWTIVGEMPSSPKQDNKFKKLFIVRPV